ncbi:phage tail tape measure protein [Flavobacterium sp.]|uniref:phage tail tape measure protein n=1 Tax=Flavobacterium sp. TaxID=239 RepID=UPI0037501B90
MSNVLEYTLSLQDQISAKLQKIGVTSDNALNKFSALQTQAKKSSQLLKDMGGSVGSLREKLNLLRAEKEWIPQSNLQSIRKYNTEIKNLEKEILKLDTINGSAFKRNLKGAISNLPFADLITNPVAQAGIALFQSGKMAMSFDEGMAKVNTTAQLSSGGVAKLKSELITMGRDAGADLSAVPAGFEKILSQTNDVALSQDILKVALKGSKAGFTDLDVVSGAVAQTLSLVGKENTNAQEVMDTLFAAKRVGAGEFKDFANYVPGLIASGQALGKGFKETAGVFAYMTAKGQSSEASAMLIQNAYTALGKKKITSGLQKSGVSVFNADGSMRQMDQIFGSLEKKMKKFGKNDKAKSNYLESIGLVDAQAKQAFMVLSSGSDKLKESINAVKNSAGETESAFKNAQNPMMVLAKMWSDVQTIALSLGDVLGIVLVPAFLVVSAVLSTAADATQWLSKNIQEGNPWLIGFAALVGLLALAHAWNTRETTLSWLATKRKLVTDKLASFWAGVGAVKTTLWAAATTLLTSAIFLVPLAIIALIAVIAYLAFAFDGWGAAWKHTLAGAKLLFQAFIESIKLWFMTYINGFMIGLNIIKLGWYKFKEAVGMGNSAENQSMIAKINADTEARQKAILDGAKKVKATLGKSGQEFKLAAGSVHSNGKTVGDFINEGKKKLGMGNNVIAPAKIPGAPVDPNAPKLPGADPTKTNDAIATGGTKNTVVNIVIKEMNGVKTGIIQGTKEAIDKAGSGLEDAILRTLAMASSAGS